jgi:hypothetical protein
MAGKHQPDVLEVKSLLSGAQAEMSSGFERKYRGRIAK